MPRLILDENMSPAIAALLNNRGHDAIAVSQIAPRIPDPDVLAWAVQENRILATFDTDFGSLIYERRLPPPPAVALFRLGNRPLAIIIQIVANALSAERNWTGFFWVITEDAIRNWLILRNQTCSVSPTHTGSSTSQRQRKSGKFRL